MMKKLYFVITILFFSISSFGQDDVEAIGFSEALKAHLKKYNVQSDIAYNNNDKQKGQILFDSLVAHHLVGTQFEDYTLKSFEKRKIKLSSFKKPVFILTYASWCIPSKGEIPALNKLAQKYAKDVQFVILFWDKKYQVKKIARKFNHNITVCYAHESYKNDALIVAHLKHTLGFPTSYFLDKDLKVVNIKRGGAQPDKKSSYVKAYTMNYNTFREGLGSLLIDKNITQEQLTTN
ncbi:TlpA family protein disulfide reductase [Flavobacterium amniphilum]|uniref:TlpA family protein disulfide reductase n=1 Tax=Flavobacterium amniphilum TaxID=1834035 RepID=UPI00202A367F|nr:TlpA disulfide reductase family protein [Flavobacterium amniphilum]MCL9806180.1 TlpA family protein disulfide reductase [Flavobacterium amniphilum]